MDKQSDSLQYHLDAICEILYDEDRIYKPRIIIEYMSRDFENKRFIKFKPDNIHTGRSGPQLKAVVDKMVVFQTCEKLKEGESVFDLDIF